VAFRQDSDGKATTLSTGVSFREVLRKRGSG
jgi:hypothetical protein